MQRKHLWLVAVLLGIFITTSLGWSVGAQAADPACTIVNRSGYPDNQVYVCYTSNVSGVSYHFDWNTGGFVQCQTSDNQLTISGQTDKYCEYYIRLDSLKQPDGKYSFTLAKSPGGRIWFSFKTPLYFHVNVENGIVIGLREPSTDNLTDPNYQTLFDKMELTYNDIGVTMNITSVDFVAIPLMFELKNNDSSYGTLGFNHTQAAIITAMKAGLAQYHMVTPYRVLSPMTLNPGSTFPRTTYYDNYVNYCWDTAFKSITFKVNVKGYWWDGTFSGDVLTLYNKDIPETHTISRPSSVEVIKCTGVFDPAGSGDFNARDGQLKDEVNEALNRSTMHLYTYDTATSTYLTNWRDETTFYKQNGLPIDKYCPNTYSDILHTVAINKLAYGFPMDEGWASKLENMTPVTDAIVTINSCKANLAPMDSLLLDGN